jgi:hypothetical protein
MKLTGTVRGLAVGLLAFSLAAPSFAATDANDVAMPVSFSATEPAATLMIPPARPRMSPELALKEYEARLSWQYMELGETDDNTTITADLPDAAKHGQYRLRRVYSAPKTLAFKTIGFVGDGFVKSNVIFRLLQSEADHVKKDQPGDTAITTANYKFSYKGTEQVDGRLTHVFQVKPRQKRAGLFKGKVYIDAYSAAMVRAEGRLVKSPSLFIKKIDFVQDYAQIGDFNLISHIHSVADTRLVGRAVVDITHDDYQVRTAEQLRASAAGTAQVREVTQRGF